MSQETEPMACWCCGKQPNPKCKCDTIYVPGVIVNNVERIIDSYCRTHKKWSLPSE